MRQLLVLRHRQLDGPAGHFGNVGDPRIELLIGRSGTSKRPAIPFVDVVDLRERDSQSAGDDSLLWINTLAHSPDRDPIAVPFGHAAAGLHRYGDSPAKHVAEFLDDIRLRERLVDVAPL